VQIYNKLSILYKYRFTQANLFKRLELCFGITHHNIIHFGRINIFPYHLKLFFGSKSLNISLFLFNIIRR